MENNKNIAQHYRTVWTTQLKTKRSEVLKTIDKNMDKIVLPEGMDEETFKNVAADIETNNENFKEVLEHTLTEMCDYVKYETTDANYGKWFVKLPKKEYGRPDLFQITYITIGNSINSFDLPNSMLPVLVELDRTKEKFDSSIFGNFQGEVDDENDEVFKFLKEKGVISFKRTAKQSLNKEGKQIKKVFYEGITLNMFGVVYRVERQGDFLFIEALSSDEKLFKFFRITYSLERDSIAFTNTQAIPHEMIPTIVKRYKEAMVQARVRQQTADAKKLNFELQQAEELVEKLKKQITTINKTKTSKIEEKILTEIEKEMKTEVKKEGK